MSKGKKRMGGKNPRRHNYATAATPTGAAGAGYNRDLEKTTSLTTVPAKSHAGTTMQELARNTTTKTEHWDQDSRLRDRPVAFVSGGFSGPLDDPEPKPANLPVTVLSYPDVTGKLTNALSGEGDALVAPMATLSTHMANIGPKPPVDRQNLHDAESDSSEEVLLFRGREGYRTSQPLSFDKPNIAKASVRSFTEKHELLGRLDHLTVSSDDEDGDSAAVNDYIANILQEGPNTSREHSPTNAREMGTDDPNSVLDSCYTKGVVIEPGLLDSARTRQKQETSCTSPKAVIVDNSHETRGIDYVKDGEDSGDVEPDNSDEADQEATDLDDEQLARLLDNQEKLGFGVDILMLASDSVLQATRKRDGRFGQRSKLTKHAAPWNRGVPSGYDFKTSLRAADGSYPSAEAVADAFEQLQVTDLGSRRHGLELELSDSDLEASLKASWQKDRQRKRIRKLEREEQRARNGLGKIHSSDPRIKYPNGMSLDEMKVEFQEFLSGSGDSAMLPPMDAHARKVIHELAHRFGLASKSTGSGKQRRPTLVRKKGTLEFNDKHFQGVFARVGRRYFGRTDCNQTNSRGFDNAGPATVRNGEVVGGTAPEIGQANKGRTMLEKMGWSIGMALGAVDNKGMTQPIAHVVKRSKAGLG